MAQKGRGEAFVNCDTLPLFVSWPCHSCRVSENWVSSGRSGHAAGIGETTTRSLLDNCIGWDRVPIKRGLGYCAWAPTKEGETSKRGRRGLGYCAWAPTPSFFFVVRFEASAKISFFFLTSFSCTMKWGGGCAAGCCACGQHWCCRDVSVACGCWWVTVCSIGGQHLC